MRICSPQLGLYEDSHLGGGVHDYEILKGLAQLGVEIEIPLMMSLECNKEENWHIYKIPLRRMYKLGALLTNTLFFIWIVYLCIKEKIDILRIPYPGLTGYMGCLVKKIFKVKTIATYHHLEKTGRLRNYLNKKLAHTFSHIITVSEFTKKQITNIYGILPEKISIVYNGVNHRYFDIVQQNASFKIGSNKKKLLFVGSLIERKNLFFLIDVLKILSAEIPDLQLIICGTGYPNDNYEERLRNYVTSAGLNEFVVFAGKVSEEQKVLYYSHCDIYVHPAIIEGFGLSVAEAMACGRPVVASNTGALPELIEDGRTGFLADPNDVHDFSKKINILLRDSDLQARMGAESRERILKKFTWERAAKETLKVFQRVYENNLHLS